jgi:hypothetical protein
MNMNMKLDIPSISFPQHSSSQDTYAMEAAIPIASMAVMKDSIPSQ